MLGWSEGGTQCSVPGAMQHLAVLDVKLLGCWDKISQYTKCFLLWIDSLSVLGTFYTSTSGGVTSRHQADPCCSSPPIHTVVRTLARCPGCTVRQWVHFENVFRYCRYSILSAPQHLGLVRLARNKTSFAMASPLSVGVATQYNLQGWVLS
jgi:hypothetical protein